MKTLLLGSFIDKQTAVYIFESFKAYSAEVTGIDIRKVVVEKGIVPAQAIIVGEVKKLRFYPDLIIVFKGLEMSPDTIKEIKNTYPKAKRVNWFFDIYLADRPIWESEQFFEVIKLYDQFFCSAKGVSDRLKEKGFSNAEYLPEACSPKYNKEVYLNSFQEEKYGSDISFIGSLGYFLQHTNRIRILNKIADEGFALKIWGDVVCDWKKIPDELKNCHMQTSVINEDHSKVVQASLITLGIDQRKEIELGFSARLYRVLCASGLYLCSYTDGLETIFKINKQNEPITGEEELIVYYTDDDLKKY